MHQFVFLQLGPTTHGWIRQLRDRSAQVNAYSGFSVVEEQLARTSKLVQKYYSSEIVSVLDYSIKQERPGILQKWLSLTK